MKIYYNIQNQCFFIKKEKKINAIIPIIIDKYLTIDASGLIGGNKLCLSEGSTITSGQTCPRITYQIYFNNNNEKKGCFTSKEKINFPKPYISNDNFISMDIGETIGNKQLKTCSTCSDFSEGIVNRLKVSEKNNNWFILSENTIFYGNCKYKINIENQGKKYEYDLPSKAEITKEFGPFSGPGIIKISKTN